MPLMAPKRPRRSAQALDWSEIARAGCTVPETDRDVEQLAKSLLHHKRDYWIVVLTARRLEEVPSIQPMAVREIIGPNVPLIFLRKWVASRLATLLPPRANVYGGALRVYRPGVGDDPYAHPLFYDETGDYGDNALDWLGKLFTPKVTGPPKLSPEQRIVTLESQLDRLTRARERELKVLRARYRVLVLGEQEVATRRSLIPARPRGSDRLADEMRLLIRTQWESYLTPEKRTTYPLRDVAMSRQFLEDLKRGVGSVSLDRVAWVCALLLCRFDVRRTGIAAGPLRPSRDAPQLTRENGERAWWCNVLPGSCGPRVVFWSDGHSNVELVAIGYPKDT